MRLTKQMRKTLQAMGQHTWTVAEMAQAFAEPVSTIRGRMARAKRAGWVRAKNDERKPLLWFVTEAGRQVAVKP